MISKPPQYLDEIKYSIKAYKEKMVKKIKNKPQSQWLEGYDRDWMKIRKSYNSLEPNYEKKCYRIIWKSIHLK